MIAWTTIGLTVAKAIGSALLTVVVSLFTGKAFKQWLYNPLARIVKKTKTKDDDLVVEQLKKDWELDK